MERLNVITKFCDESSFFMVKFPSKDSTEFGKILSSGEIKDIDLDKNEIHRSLRFKNDDMLFVFSLEPRDPMYIDSALQLVKRNMEDALMIEKVYPNIFTWIFNGVTVNALARIPSGSMKSNTTISRYGGREPFFKILNQHLKNITTMYRGKTPDYNFLNTDIEIPETILSVGSINRFNEMYCIVITPDMKYMDVIKNSAAGTSVPIKMNTLDMKYWAREINPDFIVEAKHIRLANPINLDFDKAFDLYPKAIKNLMGLKTKGNYNRSLLIRFLLSVHTPHDAKFIYLSVLGEEERKHVTVGNCASQFTYIMNNMKHYECPTFRELASFKDEEDKDLEHPLQKVQTYLDSLKKE